MKKARLTILSLLCLVFVTLAACAQSLTATPATTTPKDGAFSPSAVSKASWEAQWEKVQLEAKKEGKLSIYYAGGPEVRETLIRTLREKFGVELDMVVGRPPELITKLRRERSAGLYLLDIFMTGTGSPTAILAPDGILDSLHGAIILPEVLDKKVWWEGDIPWVDKEGYQIAFLASPKVPISVNTDLVRSGEITSYRDLLNPKWKGKIAMEDPSTLGSGNAWITAMATAVMDLDFLRALAKQELVIGRDSRVLAEGVARGKYPVGLAIKGEEITEFKKVGAPLEFIMPKEGTYVTAGAACLSLVNKAPHPNATKLFINWALTREGGTILSRSHGYQSARIDVATDFLQPENVRQPGIKYFNQDKHEYSSQKIPMQDVASQIFGLK